MRRPWLALALALGCAEPTPWVFVPGEGVDTRPTLVRAEIHDAEVCERGCQVQETPLYCGLFVPPGPGPRPTDLARGVTYCFVGTAFDETGVPFARGCALGEISSDRVEIVLGPAVLDDRPRCADGADAGLPDGGMRDAPELDAPVEDVGPLDAPLDAPAIDAGPGPFQLTVRTDELGGLDVIFRLPDRTRTWNIPPRVGSYTIPDEIARGTPVSLVPRPTWTNGHVEWLDEVPGVCVPGAVCTFELASNLRVGGRFAPCPSGVCGDFDGDGVVSDADAAAIRQALSNRYAEGCAFWRGDVAEARRTLSVEDAQAIESSLRGGPALVCDPPLP
ncbi:MAG: hypothetical protein KF901_13440 [Myxococcales bacterium]|nr:hypothetical protein [Myxococcales bacterium]